MIYRTVVCAALFASLNSREGPVEPSFYVQRRPLTVPFPDMWEMPGGKVEEGETTYQALVRELFEETGLTEADYRVFHPSLFLSNLEDGQIRYNLITYLVSIHPHAQPQAKLDQQSKWISAARFPLNMIPMNRTMLTAAQSLLRGMFSIGG